MRKTKIGLWIVFFLFFPEFSFAAVPMWKVVPNESSITFTATQNGAPVSGEFKRFSATIDFDPAQLSSNHVKVVVDMGSVSDPYDQLADTLKSADWFNVKQYPQAVFTSTKFTKTSDKTYQANGNLTIRDKTLPIVLSFTQQAYTMKQARIKGSTTIKRTAFGVGQGEWADTDAVKDEVRIDFVVSVVKQ